LTSGNRFYRTFIYTSSRSSAEWIVERPQVNNEKTFLANFGTITFSDSYATIGDNVGKITRFPYSKVIMANELSAQLASVSPLNSYGASFNVTYLRGS
jgi:hypothetical protein